MVVTTSLALVVLLSLFGLHLCCIGLSTPPPPPFVFVAIVLHFFGTGPKIFLD